MTVLEALHWDLDPESPPVSPARACRNVVLFLATFCLTVWTMRTQLPERSWVWADAKLEAFGRQADEVDVIFVGSSRAYRGFVPEVFEAVLANHGYTLRAYNMGIMGSRAPESLEVLKRIRRTNPGRLSWVLVDPESLDTLLEPRHQRSLRTIDWHDTQAFADVVRLILGSELRLDQKVEKLWDHLVTFGYHELNVSMAQPWFDDLLGLGLSPSRRTDFMGPRGDGYRPSAGTAFDRAAKGTRASERFVNEFPERIAGLKNRHKQFDPTQPRVDPLRAIFFKRFEDVVASIGAQTVFVIQPTLRFRADAQRAASQGLVQRSLDYSDPTAYPELYTLESRYDSFHASPAGAELFTHLLAADFVKILESEEQVP